jgi:response regulator RpfG family c-di-GMP phosphodiesterase/streptogramin lyase
VWVGTADGLLRMEGERPLLVAPTGWVRSFREDSDGNLWFGGGGLCRLQGNEVECADAEQVLSDDRVRSLLEDREGNLWVGVDGGGLHRLRDGKVTTYSTPHGLPDKGVLPVVGDGGGGVWIGTNAGLVHWRAGRFTPLLQEDGSPFLFVSALWRDRSGGLWIGHDGLTHYADGGYRRYSLRHGLPDTRVQTIFEDSEGRLWVGTPGGLSRRVRDRFETLTVDDGLVHDDVRHISQGRDGTLWIGTTHGLSRFGDGVFDNLTTSEGLTHDVVRDIHEDAQGTIWIGTYGGGLGRLRDGEITAITREHGLEDNVVSRILVDSEDHFWMSGNRGIHRVRRDLLDRVAESGLPSIRPLGLGAAEGMRSSECNGRGQPAGWRTSDGRLWFPTIDGVAVIDPAHLPSNVLAPPVIIEKLLIDGFPENTRRPVSVPPGRHDVEIHYTGLSFVDPERVRFRYQLEGLDTSWVEAGGRRVAYYTAVPPGAYTFRVIAANEEGRWNPSGAVLELDFAPAFHQTRLFMVLSALASAAVGAGLYRLRVRQLRARERELSTVVQERTRELVTKQRELTDLNLNLTTLVAERTQEIRHTRDLAVLTLAKLAELRDDDTGHHMERIADYSRTLAIAMRAMTHPEIHPDYVEELFRSSPLHDIGKVAIPDEILRKPGPLTSEETEIMQTHCEVGGEALRQVIQEHEGPTFLAMALEIASSHHERWDGTGYPQGTAGEAIPLCARIVALADVYDAIRSRRPYKEEGSHEAALNHIVRQRGFHFDPEIVDAFLSVGEEFDSIYNRLRPEG